jgi:transcriptional regulator with XRE-family HTH domain
MNAQLFTLKAKQLGIKLANFRQQRGLSIKELSHRSGLPYHKLEHSEHGESSLSLPQLELVGLSLGVAVNEIFSNNLEKAEIPPISEHDQKNYSSVRDRVIGLQVFKQRTEKAISPRALAQKCEITPEELNEYESGEKSIPLPMLELLCKALEINLTELISKNISVPGTVKENTAVEKSNFPNNLSVELRAFIDNPSNLPYLELARRLSTMDAVKLRSIAEGLLEITY